MASVNAFNQTLQEFLNELVQVFPEETSIQTQIEKFELKTVTDSRVALDAVMPELAKRADMISKRDDAVMVHMKDIFPEIDFIKLWGSDVSENTKKAIWDYLNTLLMLGTTIMTIPTNMLSEIEKIAQSCVSQMQENQTQPDQVFIEAQKAIFNNGMLQNLMGNMGQQMGNMGNLGNLGDLSQMQPTLQPPKQTKVNNKPKNKKGKKK